MILDNKNKNFSKKFLLSLIISSFLLYYSFQNFNYKIFLSMFTQIDYYSIILSVLLLLLSVYLRAFRWKIILHNKVSTNYLYKAQLIGYFGNNVFPFRIGEWLKSYFVSKKNNISISKVFGSVVLERVLDMLGVGMIFILLFLFDAEYLGLINEYFFYGVIFFLFIGISGCFLSIFKNEKFLFKKKSKILLILKDIYNGFSRLNKNNFIKISIITLIIWAIYLANVYLVQSAFQLYLTINQCMILLIISTIAISIPALPGSFGTFEGAVFYALSLFGIVDNFGFSLMLHLVSYIPYTLFGLIYFIQDFKFYKYNFSLQRYEN